MWSSIKWCTEYQLKVRVSFRYLTPWDISESSLKQPSAPCRVDHERSLSSLLSCIYLSHLFNDFMCKWIVNIFAGFLHFSYHFCKSPERSCRKMTKPMSCVLSYEQFSSCKKYSMVIYWLKLEFMIRVCHLNIQYYLALFMFVWENIFF